MNNNGTCTYVLAMITGPRDRYYCGMNKSVHGGHIPKTTSNLDEALVYDDEDYVMDDLIMLRAFFCAWRIIEIQKCPSCGKKYADHSAISRKDNKTEICTSCGVLEAIEAYTNARKDQ